MIISYREAEYQDPKTRFQNLGKEIRFLHENIKTQERYLQNAKTEEEYERVLKHIKDVERQIADKMYEFSRLQEAMPDFETVQQEKEKYGFAVSQHAVKRHNERFAPYLTREQIAATLAKYNFNDRIESDKLQIIRLLPNYNIVVMNRTVITFLYDDEYYKGMGQS